MEANAARVFVNVLASGCEVVVAIDHPGVEPTLEQMPNPVVPAVESLCVESVQPLHPIGEIRLHRLEHEVEVVVEQDPGMQNPDEATRCLVQRSPPPGAVDVVEHDRPLFDAS